VRKGHASAAAVVDGSLAKPVAAEAPPLPLLPLVDLELDPELGNETAARERSLPSERQMALAAALFDHSAALELVDGSAAKARNAETAPLKSLTLAGAELAGELSHETTLPQRSEPQTSTKAPGPIGVGWWVILGSFNVGKDASGTMLIASGVKRASGAAHRCGMAAFNDFSSKFRGFAPGYVVVVIGPFTDKGEAARTQQRLNGCISGSYVKYAQHFGD
jgi:hypothetical protein